MQDGSSVSTNGAWWSLSNATPLNWSSDKKTFSITRDNAGLLPVGTTIQVILNPTTQAPGFKDLAGNALDTYTFSFTTAN